MSSPVLPRHRLATAPERARTADRRPVDPAAARYRYDRVTGAWWWSPEMSQLLGLDADTPPSIEALVAASHHADGHRLRLALADAVERGGSFALETRVVLDSGRAQRTVILVGEPFRDDSGAVRGIDGVCAALTRVRAGDDGGDRVPALEAEVSQMRAAMASRAVIEQAKGILMLLTACGEQVAFGLLTHISSHTHRKVREVAHLLADSAAGGNPLPADVAAILRDACPPGKSPH